MTIPCGLEENTQKILGTPYRWTVELPDSVAQNQLIDWCKRCDGKFISALA
jgi:hypothetical protein